MEARIGPARANYHALLADPAHLDDVLAAGAQRARTLAQATLARVRAATGMNAVPRGLTV
jgi:tryptophanyl-tRNA synthetase